MKRLAVVIAFALFALPAVAAEDLSGKWTGSFSGVGPDGKQLTESLLLTLAQKGTALTGTAGPSTSEQMPVLNGKVEGTKITFDVHSVAADGPLFRFTLALALGHLKGEINAVKEGLKLTAKVDLARAK